MPDWVLVAAMALVTFIPRYLPFGLAGRIYISAAMSRALHFVPIAVLSAIVAQSVFMRGGEFSVDLSNHHLLAAAVACVVALKTGHLFLTIALGLISYGFLSLI